MACPSAVPLSLRRISVQPAGAEGLAPVPPANVICASSTSPFTTPVGFASARHELDDGEHGAPVGAAPLSPVWESPAVMPSVNVVCACRPELCPFAVSTN